MRLAWLLVVAACYGGAARPEAPTCTTTAEHVRSLLGAGGRSLGVRDVFAARCDADGWSAAARECIVATASLRQPRGCKALLDDTQRAALDRALGALSPRTPADGTPQACRDYRALIDKLGSCLAISPVVRAALERSFRDLLAQRARGVPADAPSLETQCRWMADNLRQAITPVCGW